MSKMFDLLKEGFEEAIAYERGLSKNVRVRKVTGIPKQSKECLTHKQQKSCHSR